MKLKNRRTGIDAKNSANVLRTVLVETLALLKTLQAKFNEIKAIKHPFQKNAIDYQKNTVR
uniref:Uncharacterized protein n=1 Tax=Romanomermis culicivorax TaxID=13658 RepID=A0A915JYN5_ROMCU